MDSRSSNFLLTRYPRVSVIMAGHDPTGLAVKIEKKMAKMFPYSFMLERDLLLLESRVHNSLLGSSKSGSDRLLSLEGRTR